MAYDGLWTTSSPTRPWARSPRLQRRRLDLHPRGAGRVRRPLATSGGRAWKNGALRRRGRPGLDPAAQGRPGRSSTTDEGIRADTTAESLAGLRPAFRKDGTITAGSASQISDGACAVVVMSKAKAEELGLEWLAEIGAHGVVAGPDSTLQSQPARAIAKACEQGGHRPGRPRPRRAQRGLRGGRASPRPRELGLDPEIVNVNGGAIALGHPVGMSGARIVLHLALELKRRGGGVGAAALCGGGGQGDALILRSRPRADPLAAATRRRPRRVPRRARRGRGRARRRPADLARRGRLTRRCAR